MADTFMLIRNADGDPLFMELTAGILYWLLPNEIPFTSIIYLTHITEDSKLYYENLTTKEVQWEINGIDMSEEAKIVLSTVQQMSRNEVEEILGALFDIDKIDELITTIDNFFLDNEAPTVTRRRCSSIVTPIDPPVEDNIKNKDKLNSTSISYMEEIFNRSLDPVSVDSEPLSNASSIKESIKVNGKFRNSIQPMSRKTEPLSNLHKRQSSIEDSESTSLESPINRPEPPANISASLYNRSLPPPPPAAINSRESSSKQDPPVNIAESPINRPEPPVNINTNLSNRSLPPTPATIPDPPSRRPSSIPDPPINRPGPPFVKASSMESSTVAEDTTKSSCSNANTRKSIFDINKTFKTGYLNKLAKKSGINWKARYFVLGVYNISYFESEKTNEKLRGEVTITPESTVYSDKHDPKRGYLFKLTNQWETLVLAAASEIERNEWIKEINMVVKNAKHYLMCYCALLQPSTSYIIQKKYFVLANGILTFHSSSQTTSKIEGKIILSDKTIIDKMDDFNQLITISDSNSFLNRISFQFKQVDPVFRTNPTELYHQWRKELLRLINPTTTSSSGSINTRKSIRFSISDNMIDDNITKPMNALQVNAIRRTSIKRNSIINIDNNEQQHSSSSSHPLPQVPPRPLSGHNNEKLHQPSSHVVHESMKQSNKSNLLPSESLNIDAPIRIGKLIKLSRKTGLKWSERKFILKPFQIAYYDSEVENGIIKGEVQITSQCSVVTEFKSDNKLGYLFKFTNQFESITLAASSESERDDWVKDISTAIKYASKCIFSSMILKRPLFKNHNDKYFLIFGFDTISIHQSEQQTSDLKGVFKFSNETVIEELDDYNKAIALNDPKSNISSLSFSCTYVDPKSKYNAAQLYGIWKSAISRIVETDNKMNNEVEKYNSKSMRRNSRKSISLETTNISSVEKTPWCNSTNLNSNTMKMNALETNTLRRASLRKTSMNKTTIEEDCDESLLLRPSFLALPPAPPPPSQNNDNDDDVVEDDHQFQYRKSDVSNAFTIDTCYDDQSKSNHMMKGEQNIASRAALKMQLSKLKEMKQQQATLGNFKPPPPPTLPNTPQNKIKNEVNPLLKNFQSPKNPLARSKH